MGIGSRKRKKCSCSEIKRAKKERENGEIIKITLEGIVIIIEDGVIEIFPDQEVGIDMIGDIEKIQIIKDMMTMKMIFIMENIINIVIIECIKMVVIMNIIIKIMMIVKITIIFMIEKKEMMNISDIIKQIEIIINIEIMIQEIDITINIIKNNNL